MAGTFPTIKETSTSGAVVAAKGDRIAGKQVRTAATGTYCISRIFPYLRLKSRFILISHAVALEIYLKYSGRAVRAGSIVLGIYYYCYCTRSGTAGA